MRLFGYAAALLLMLFSASAAGAVGGGQARIGYIIVDEEGNLGVNQESYNLYEGLALSLDNFHYRAGSGIDFQADFRNITLNNRSLRASVSKPGEFSFSFRNQQYRRIHSFDGDRFTRRRTTGGDAHVFVTRHVKLFGGFSLTDKHGDTLSLISPDRDSIVFSTDYSHSAVTIGGQVFYPQGSLTARYQASADFSDNADIDGSRNAKSLDISAFAPLPKYDRIVLSGGYHHRQDSYVRPSRGLATDQGWAAARAQLPYNLTAEYRFAAARSDHSQRPAIIDNYINTASLGRQWPRHGGIRVGYENRICDDIMNRTIAQAFLFSGWFKYNDRLMVRGGVTIRDKDVKEGVILVGEEQLTRYQLSARYHVAGWGDLSGSYRGRVRTRDDIETRAEYNAFSTELALHREAYGRLTLTYAYYSGSYENRPADISAEFRFNNHVVTGMITPRDYRRVHLSFGGTYYRSRRDLDTEKFGLRIQGRYALPENYEVEVSYQALNFDDFLVIDRYYTGNIVDLYLIKGFDF